MDRSPISPPATGRPGHFRRIPAVDAVRGLVMVLMALDHARDFFTAFTGSPTDPATTDLALFVTRYITHPCATTFVFLAGLSIHLSLRRNPDRRAKALACLTRGALLIAMEATLVSLGWGTLLMLQAIWALGACLIVMAGVLYLRDRAILTLSLVLILLHDLLDPIRASQLGSLDWLWILLHQVGNIPLGHDHHIFLLYPLVPWIGVMPLGYLCGRLYDPRHPDRSRILWQLALGCLVLFLTLRLGNLYGDPKPWLHMGSTERSLYSFLDVAKYPPSLDFLLATLAATFAFLAWFDDPRRPGAATLATYGRAALFFYLAHIYLLHALGLAYAWKVYGQTTWMSDPVTAEHAPGAPLWVVYLAWLTATAVLYPACQAVGRYKARHRSWWTSLL